MSKREFEVFYLKVRTPCFRALCVTVPNRDEAEELLAEAFSRAFQNWSEIRHHPSPSAWIVRTALNLHRDNWRKSVNARRHLVAVPDKYEDQTSMVDPVLLRHMRNLPEQQFLVVIHRVLLDLSTEQTAKALGIAEGTVSTHLKRGLANLREVLETHKVMEALNES